MDRKAILAVLEDLFFIICYISRLQTRNITYYDFKEHCMLPKLLNTEEWLTKYNNLQFFQLFRLEINTFEKLVTVIRKVDDKNILMKKYGGGHYPIDLQSQLLIFLWYMSSQETLLAIGARFNIATATVMNIVNKMLYFLLKLTKTYIVFPKSEEELLIIAHGFKQYPGVVGATHVFVKIEQEQQESYIDQYRRHSINIMAICDSNTLFTYVFSGYPGAAHDARVFEQSTLYKNIEKYGPNNVFIIHNKYHLIGDSTFGLRTLIMTPYRDNNNLTTRMDKYHNKCLSSEHAFGALKGRWRRLQYINTYNICKTIEIATAACILHNFCILNKDLWSGECIYNQEPPIINNIRNIDDRVFGQVKRERIARDLFMDYE